MLIAQNLDSIQSVGLPGFIGGDSIGEFISNSGVLDYVFAAAGLALLVYLISGGLQMMTSRGDPKAIQGAQGKITSALVGFIIVFLSYYIVGVIGRIFSLDAFVSIFRR